MPMRNYVGRISSKMYDSFKFFFSIFLKNTPIFWVHLIRFCEIQNLEFTNHTPTNVGTMLSHNVSCDDQLTELVSVLYTVYCNEYHAVGTCCITYSMYCRRAYYAIPQIVGSSGL